MRFLCAESGLKAFEILGIELSSTEEDIKKAYREKSKSMHPDMHDDPDDLQKNLNIAYKKALQVVHSGFGLILLDQTKTIGKIESEIRSNKAQIRTTQIAAEIKNRKTSRLHKWKYIAIVIAMISGLMGLFTTNFSSFYKEFVEKPADTEEISQAKNLKDNAVEKKKIEPENQKPIPKPTNAFGFVLGMYAFLFGIIAIYFQFAVTRIDHKVEEMVIFLSDKKVCAYELAEQLNWEDITIITERDLPQPKKYEGIFDIIFLGFSFEVPKEEKIKLIISKAEEHKLIERLDDKHITPDSTDSFKVAFRPSLFKPKKV